MSFKSGGAVVLVAAVILCQVILLSGAKPGAASGKLSADITFDCDPAQLHGVGKLICLAKRFEEGRRLFDEETFGGNGRTCATCHSVKNGTFSPQDAQERLAQNPNDPLFVGDGLDDSVQGTARITEHATVRIEIPLPPRVKLLNDPTATTVILLRGTPTTRNTPSLQPVFMYDGRDTTLEGQALGAVQDAHALGVKHTAPYFHDNSAKTLKEVAEHYTIFFQTEAGITLTPQDEADMVAFLKLL
jgi:cytochrome c peroxidase